MDEQEDKLNLLGNPAFLRYVKNLPTVRRRILQVPGDTPEHDRYVIATQTGDNPPELSKEAPQNQSK